MTAAQPLLRRLRLPGLRRSSVPKAQRDPSWSSVQLIQRRIWERFTGDEATSVPEMVNALLESRLGNTKPRLQGMAIACGNMAGARYFFESDQLPFSRVDGFDGDAAELKKYEPKLGLKFKGHAGDLNKVTLPQNAADLIVAWHGMHLVENVTRVFAQSSRALKPNGLFVMYQWIGPRSGKLPMKNRLVASSLLRALFPLPSTRTTHMGERRGFTTLRGPLCAANIEQATLWEEFNRFFTPLHTDFHGGLAYAMLEGIAHNIDETSAVAQLKLRAIDLLEQRLIAAGAIEPLFVLCVGEAKKRRARGA